VLADYFTALADWFSGLSFDPVVAECLFLAAIALVAVLRLALRRTRVERRLDSALTLIVLGLLAGSIAELGPRERRGLFLYAYAFFIAAVAIGTIRSGLILFVDFHLRERRGAAVSTIFRDVASVLVYFLIILAVLRFTLDINLASLIATSAVLTAIIGLAFQDVLGAVISGLVLELEDPFGPDDWVQVGSFEGQIIETGWRTTKVRTRVNQLVTVPNTFLAREPVVNYSRPDPRYGDTLTFEAAYEAPPHMVKQAVFAVLQAERAVLTLPPAEVRTNAYNASGIEYAIRYWIDNYGEVERIRSRIMTNLWYSLRRAGVRIPFPARDVFVYSDAPPAQLETGDVAAAIRGVPLFVPLGEDRIRQLSTRSRRLIFGDGESIVREGEKGDSFFIVEQGRVRVVLGHTDGRPGREIARLGPGDYFGEMSLLAGDPRTATVVAEGDVAVLEIGGAAFQEIVVADPAILEPICQLAAHRSDAQAEHRRVREEIQPLEKDVAAQRLLKRIKAFFRV
jgi:small-conductance mechanosensitive channel/CRP-like cAMP-binding protein